MAGAASATESSAVRGKQMDAPKVAAQDNGKRDDPPKKPTSAVPAVTSKAGSPDAEVLPDIVRAYAEGRFELSGDGRVVWTDAWYRGEAFAMEDN